MNFHQILEVSIILNLSTTTLFFPMGVEELPIYSIKSCARIEVQQALMTEKYQLASLLSVSTDLQ